MPHTEALKKLGNQLLLTAFYAIDALCIVHSTHADKNWDLYDARRKEIRQELIARGLQPEGFAFEALWQLARKDLSQ